MPSQGPMDGEVKTIEKNCDCLLSGQSIKLLPEQSSLCPYSSAALLQQVKLIQRPASAQRTGDEKLWCA